MSATPTALLRGATVVASFGLLVWLERRRPLRRTVEPGPRRVARNLAVASVAAATVALIERPLVAPLANKVVPAGWGLLQWVRLPGWLEVALAVVLMDYSLYGWHVLTHRVPFLWRFHQPHHVDLDLDASTALRFHFGELALSVAFRAAQVVVLGVPPHALAAWQTALVVSILFHHSNVRLPARLERALSHVVVTPRLHGIHHSMVREETNSNWSSGLTLWDWLHGTLRRDVAQDAITIGVPAYRDRAEVTLGRVLAMPFRAQRPTWQLPGGGGEPARARGPGGSSPAPPQRRHARDDQG